MTEKKPTNTENPSIVDSCEAVVEALDEADYNDDAAWNYIPSFLFKKKDEEGEYYDIEDAWGSR